MGHQAPTPIRRLISVVLATLSVLVCAGCGLSEIPGNIRRNEALRATRYPWTATPIDEQSRVKLCQALQPGASDVLCQPGRPASISDLVRTVQRRFPINKTPYAEVERVLQDFPSAVEESRMPDGTVTGRTYAYLLTQFRGFCIYFDTDVSTGLVDRIDNTKAPGIFDGPVSDTCGPARRR